MKHFKTMNEWIKKAEDDGIYYFNSALEEMRDQFTKEDQCRYSSNEVAEFIINYEGGIANLYVIKELMELCYDVSYEAYIEE